MRSLVACTAAGVLLVAGAACSGGGEAPASTATATTAPATVPAGTAAVSPAASPPGDTPTEFESLRDALAERLDNLGANVGAVPDDIRDELVAECEALSAYVNSDDLRPLCASIAQAIDQDDPGLIDLVVNGLAELTEG